MQDHAAFDLDRCREMDFGQLLRFTEDSLARLSEPDPGVDRPHSPEEFRRLVQMLRELDDMPKVAPVPLVYDRPKNSGPSAPSWSGLTSA
jgi:hypothetical protein